MPPFKSHDSFCPPLQYGMRITHHISFKILSLLSIELTYPHLSYPFHNYPHKSHFEPSSYRAPKQPHSAPPPIHTPTPTSRTTQNHTMRRSPYGYSRLGRRGARSAKSRTYSPYPYLPPSTHKPLYPIPTYPHTTTHPQP